MSKPKETIHSGHFMISNPHEVKPDEDDEGFEVDVVDVDDSMTESTPNERTPRQDKDEKPVTFYKFGPQKTQSIAIDISLNKLKKCINVAYMKLTTPKWKDFKGLKLQWKHRIRLNNVIWRAYYMEFRKPDKKKKTPHCYFAVPDDDTTHMKIEGSVLEGMYWKRRMEAVCAQYKKWRTYNRPAKKRSKCCRKKESSCNCNYNLMYPNRPGQSHTPNNLSTFEDYDIDDFDNEFTNSLFESLKEPFIFPNAKEVGSDQMGNADIMQPCLVSLQPSLEEIMGDMSANPGFEMQQQQFQSVMHHDLMNNDRPIAHNYRPKEYESPRAMMDYASSQQPTRQSNVVHNGLMSTQISQPLYSRAFYDSMASIHASPQQPFMNDDSSGRASSTVSFGAPTPQPYSFPHHLIAAASSGITVPSTPSPALSSLNVNSPFHSQEQNFFRSRFMTDNGAPMLQQAQQPQSNGQLWFNIQQQPSPAYQLPNEHSRRMAMMLQSPNSASPLGISPGMPNSGMSFNAPNLINLAGSASGSPSLSNLVPSPNLMNGQPVHIMPNAGLPALSHYLTNSPLALQPHQMVPGLPDILGKSSRNYDTTSSFPQVKVESKPPFLSSQVAVDSPNSLDGYGSMPSVGPSTSQNVPQTAPVFPSAEESSATPTPQLFRSASVGDAPNPILTEQAASFTPTSNRFHRGQKRNHAAISSRSSPNYTQAASTSSSDAILSDSEGPNGGDDEKPRSKRSNVSCKVELDESLHPDERKRILHLNAEKNRRTALKDGFEMLTTVIPTIDEAGIKPTNAVVLNRAAQYIRMLRTESERRKQDLVNFKDKIDKINSRIAMLQSNLPSTCRSQSTTNSSANTSNQVEQSFERHMRERSRQDYRYWLMAQMMKPLIQHYANTVHADANALQQVANTVRAWLSKYWNVNELRPLASKMLIFLATEVNVLKNSAALPEHVLKEIDKSS